MTKAKKKTNRAKKTNPKSEASFELVGGIYFVERFPDGRELREEIDGEVVLNLISQIVCDYARDVLAARGLK
jgi:hypothetical protein